MSDTFTARRVVRSATLHLPAPPEQVFPLFGPVREAEWAEGWQPHILYSASPLADELGAVFTTHHPGEPETIWLVAAYDAAKRLITYARLTPGSRIARVIIQCDPAPGGATEARVTYEFTGLSEQGNATLDAFTEEHYQHMMAEWQAAIGHTLTTGGRLAHHQ